MCSVCVCVCVCVCLHTCLVLLLILLKVMKFLGMCESESEILGEKKESEILRSIFRVLGLQAEYLGLPLHFCQLCGLEKTSYTL